MKCTVRQLSCLCTNYRSEYSLHVSHSKLDCTEVNLMAEVKTKQNYCNTSSTGGGNTELLHVSSQYVSPWEVLRFVLNLILGNV